MRVIIPFMEKCANPPNLMSCGSVASVEQRRQNIRTYVGASPPDVWIEAAESKLHPR